MTIEVFSRPPRDPQLSSGSSGAVKSSPHWFGLPILLWALSFSVQAGCVESAKVCTDSDDRTINGTTVHRDCWRWEMTYACTEDSPEKDRCESAALPQTCAIVGEACSASDADAGCLEVEKDLLCTAEPSGPGITAKDPIIQIAFSTTETSAENPSAQTLTAEASPSLAEGCEIVERSCLDAAPRMIPVENLSGETAEAAPSCWKERLTIACPSASAAASCHKLEAAGCTPEADSERVCERRAEDGACLIWSAAYVCKGVDLSEDENGDLVLDGSAEVPDGPAIEDDSACRAEAQKLAADGFACAEISRTCTDPAADLSSAESCRAWTASYSCTAEGKNGCQTLDALAESGTCRLEEEPECLASDTVSGETVCIRKKSVYKCGDLGSLTPDDAEFLGEIKETTQTAFNECGQIESDSTCIETGKTCIDGPAIKLVDGKPVYRDCWVWSREWTCRLSELDECAHLETDKRCTLVSESCPEGETDCPRPTRVYRCTTPGSSTAMGTVCSGQACINGVCAPTDDAADESFGQTIAELEIGRQAGLYGDAVGGRFFSGTVLSCRDRKGASSCCRSEPAPQTSNTAFALYLNFGVSAAAETIKYLGSPYVYDVLAYSDSTKGILNAIYGNAPNGVYEPTFSFWGTSLSWTQSGGWQFDFSPSSFALAAALHFYDGWAACTAEDHRLAMAKGERLCVYIGTQCSKHTPGLGCTEREERYVCFNSRLARILNQEGRRQLGRGWGTAQFPDADGFTPEELAALDFSQMDLSEFVADIVSESLKSAEDASGKALERAQSRVEEMLAGKLGNLAAPAGPTGATRTP